MNIYIVDDEVDFSKTLASLLIRNDFEVETFPDGGSFVKVAKALPLGCVLLDIRLPDMTGLQVQEALLERGSDHAVIVLTGFGDVPQAVRAIKGGAVDFLQKPFHNQQLLDAIAAARPHLEAAVERGRRADRLSALRKLSPREIDVLNALAKDETSKQIAFKLGISTRTVEMHRSNILRKLDVHTISSALLLAQSAEILTP